MTISHPFPDQRLSATAAGRAGYMGRVLQPPYFSFLLWLLFAEVFLFLGFVAYHEGLAGKVVAADQSKITLLIVAVFAAASFYAAVQLYRVCGLLERSYVLLGRRALDDGAAGPTLVDDFLDEMSGVEGPSAALGTPLGTALDGAELARGEVDTKRHTVIDKANYIFEIYVDQLRHPLETLSFWSDTLIRLGLIGTIVGFIMMLQSFITGPSPTAENIQALLITMSKGMGTALYTTFAGLVASTFVSLQQRLLARVVEGVIAGLIRLSGVPGKGLDEMKTQVGRSSEGQ